MDATSQPDTNGDQVSSPPAEAALEVTTKDLKAVFDGMLASGRAELAAMSQADLEQFWYFEWNDARSLERNLYDFHDLLGLYQRKCRQWEEMHHGSVRVVERVRDTYLWPKLPAFTAKMAEVLQAPARAPLAQRSGTNGDEVLSPMAEASLEDTEKKINAVYDGMMLWGRTDLEEMPQTRLGQFWHFRWDEAHSIEHNLYKFHRMLEIYRQKCRQWEEMHHGTLCVVERVRDAYLWPKLQAFTAKMAEVMQAPAPTPPSEPSARRSI